MKRLLVVCGLVFVICGLWFISQKSFDLYKVVTTDKTYIILLQNNNELRPSGGFMGSFLRLEFLEGISTAKWRIVDIYQPDGQITGHVEPPIPIQQAFALGDWRLRDANWNHDFTIAGGDIAWFLTQAGLKTDGIVAINLALTKKLFVILGEIYVPEYDLTLTDDNLWQVTQGQSELGFFPGSTQKPDFIQALTTQVMLKIKQASALKILRISWVIFSELNRGEVLFWFAEPRLKVLISKLKIDGSKYRSRKPFIYFVDSNLSANKADCCIERDLDIYISGTKVKLVYSIKNTNLPSDVKPPSSWGGDYRVFSRVILSDQVQITNIATKGGELTLFNTKNIQPSLVNGIDYARYFLETNSNEKVLGWWSYVPANSLTETKIELMLPKTITCLFLTKQPGVPSYTVSLYESLLLKKRITLTTSTSICL